MVIPKRFPELVHSRALAVWQHRLFILSHFLKNGQFFSCLMLVFLHNNFSSFFFFSFLGPEMEQRNEGLRREEEKVQMFFLS